MPGGGLHKNGTGVAVGQLVPVRFVDHPGSALPGAGVGGQPGTAVGAERANGDDPAVCTAVDLQLDPLPGPDAAGGDGVDASLKRNQAVLADPAQVLVG